MDRPASANDLLHLARDFGLEGTALRMEPDDLSQMKLPLILHWRLNHWIVLWKIKSDHYLVDDPACGRCWLDRTAIQTHFSGIAIELIAESPATADKLTDASYVHHPKGASNDQRIAEASMLFYAIVMAIFQLATPFAAKIMIDLAPLSHQVSVLLWLSGLYFASQALALFSDRRLRKIVIDQDHHRWRHSGHHRLTATLSNQIVGAYNERHRFLPLTRTARLELEKKRLGLTAVIVIPAVLVIAVVHWSPTTPLFMLDSALIALIHARQERVQSKLHYAASAAKRHFEFEQGSLARCRGNAHQLALNLGLKQRYRVRLTHLIHAAKMLELTLLDHEIAQALWSALIKASFLGLLVYGLMTGEVSMASFFLLANYHALYRQHWQAWWAAREDTQPKNSPGMPPRHESDQQPRAPDGGTFEGSDPITLTKLTALNPLIATAACTLPAAYWVDTSRFTSKTLQTLLLRLDASDNPLNAAILQDLNISADTLQVCDFGCPLFDASVADHLTQFDLSPDADRLMNCLELMGLKKTVFSWPLGLNTRLSPTGAPLDGIGRAKLALAACLYHAPSVLIIDHREQRLGLADIQDGLQAAAHLGHTVIYLSPIHPYPHTALSENKLDAISNEQ